MHLGEGMEMLGLPCALLAERAGTAAKLGLLFCGSLPKPAVYHAQPTWHKDEDKGGSTQHFARMQARSH